MTKSCALMQLRLDQCPSTFGLAREKKRFRLADNHPICLVKKKNHCSLQLLES